MKKVIFVFAMIFAAGVSLVSAQGNSEKYRIDGKSHSKQIFDYKNKQITHFANWELIENFFVSPDESKLLVYHRPNKAKAFLITLYDLPSGKQIAETEPGWACRDIRWTKDYLIYIWATSGGGTRFEYRSYKSLKIEKGVQSYLFFEDEEEDLLFDTQYFGGNANLGVAVYKFSDGSHIKTFDFIDELYKKVWTSGEPKIKAAEENKKGIFVHIDSISNFRKTGNRKYAFELDYVFATEDDEQCEDRSLTMEIEL